MPAWVTHVSCNITHHSEYCLKARVICCNSGTTGWLRVPGAGCVELRLAGPGGPPWCRSWELSPAGQILLVLLSVQKSVKMKACCKLHPRSHINSQWCSHFTSGNAEARRHAALCPSLQRKEMGWNFILGLLDLIQNTATYWFSVLHTSAFRSWFLEFFSIYENLEL